MTTLTLKTPWSLTTHEQSLLESLADYTSLQVLPAIWPLAAQRFTTLTALHDPHSEPELRLSYPELAQQIQQFATSLSVLGFDTQTDNDIPPRIALFSDNSPRWFIADQGTMHAGFANAVRSSQADRDELLYILEDSGAIALIAENLETYERLKSGFAALNLKLVLLLSDETPVDEPESLTRPYKLMNFSQFMALGAQQPPCPLVERTHETLATLIYTSGTTGRPKGVMLTHGNLLHQVIATGTVVQPKPGDTALSILPTWHSYERAVEYFLLSQGCTQVYTNLRSVKKDLQTYAPDYMVSVPRIWESIYEAAQKQFQQQSPGKRKLIDTCLQWGESYVKARRRSYNLALEQPDLPLTTRLKAKAKAIALKPLYVLADRLVYKKVRAATGGQIKQIISGGGSLATHLELFFEMIGVELLVGYGLTETAPILAARRPWHNLRGSAGLVLPGTQLKIVDPQTRAALPVSMRGLVLAKGPQVMKGYFNKPQATHQAIDPEGWFNTGDLGMLLPGGDLVLTGRAKDTIVLTNGENIEPQPIEDACLRSVYIDQIMLVGQDQKSLGALIVPNLDTLREWASTASLTAPLPDQLSEQPTSDELAALNQSAVQTLLRQEVSREVKQRRGYRPDDRITTLRVLGTPFSMQNGLITQTLKIRRLVVQDRYQDMINEMFSN
ncbi:MAG: AMP-binding protein [Cyanobacteria bacterium P01_H01_bin.121]